jgi:hypothetical protein
MSEIRANSITDAAGTGAPNFPNGVSVGGSAVTATAAELNVLDGITAIASQAEAEAGTSSTTLMTPLRTEQAISVLASIPAYTGTETTPTTGTSYTFNHGLGRLPYHVQAHLRCATASNGFSVNNYLLLTPWQDSTAGVGIWFTTTSIVVRTGTSVGYIAPSGYAALTLSNFRINVQAW